MKDFCRLAHTDSELHNEDADVDDDHEDTDTWEKGIHVWSQHGALITVTHNDHFDVIRDMPLIVVAWRFTSSKRTW